jgi:predicted transcriptional regulator
MTPNNIKSVAYGLQNRALVLDALPDSVRGISKRVGFARSTVQWHLAKLISEGKACRATQRLEHQARTKSVVFAPTGALSGTARAARELAAGLFGARV